MGSCSKQVGLTLLELIRKCPSKHHETVLSDCHIEYYQLTINSGKFIQSFHGCLLFSSQFFNNRLVGFFFPQRRRWLIDFDHGIDVFVLQNHLKVKWIFWNNWTSWDDDTTNGTLWLANNWMLVHIFPKMNGFHQISRNIYIRICDVLNLYLANLRGRFSVVNFAKWVDFRVSWQFSATFWAPFGVFVEHSSQTVEAQKVATWRHPGSRATFFTTSAYQLVLDVLQHRTAKWVIRFLSRVFIDFIESNLPNRFHRVVNNTLQVLKYRRFRRLITSH